jgi:hypothetical protein
MTPSTQTIQDVGAQQCGLPRQQLLPRGAHVKWVVEESPAAYKSHKPNLHTTTIYHSFTTAY